MASSSNRQSSNTGSSSTGNTGPGRFRFPPCPQNAVLNQRRFCHCPALCVLRVSTVEKSLNRIFFSCRNYIDKEHPGCGFFLWAVDEGVAQRTAEAVHQMQATLEHAVLTTISTELRRIEQKMGVMDSILSSVTQLERKLMAAGRHEINPFPAASCRNVSVLVVVLCLLYAWLMK